MRDSIYRITLDIHDTSSQALLDVKKDDSSRQIKFTLMDGGKPYTITSECTAVFRAKKPDGTILYNNCTIADNVITYTLTNQTSAAVGILECEVTLYGANSHQITSPRFTMRVEDNLYSDSEVESEDEFTQLAQAITATNNLNVSASKSGSTATITITKKDGTTQTATVSDGSAGPTGPAGADGEDGEDGYSPSATVSKVGTKATITITDRDGTTTAEINDGAKGDPGTLDSVTASVDANTGTPSVNVTYNGSSADFAFHNLKGTPGANGTDGTDGKGISSIAKTGTVGKVDTYTITYTDSTTSTFTVTNGQDGEGKGIVSITKTGTVGKVDTYTITYTDATTTTFNVTNGNDGTNGADGQDGEDGEDGVSVTGVTINSSGHLIVTLSSGSTIDAGVATGDSGVYIGTTPPTDPNVRVWIDTSGSAGDVEMVTNKVTSWTATTTNTHYPSEKLVKDSLDGKAASSHSHSASDITSGTLSDTYIASASTWNGKYTKPSGGVPDSDIASASTWNGKSNKSSILTGTLTVAGWSNNTQTLSISGLAVNGYAYTVAPSGSDFTKYAEAMIYADDVTVTDTITFHCDSVPTDDIDIVILKVQVV